MARASMFPLDPMLIQHVDCFLEILSATKPQSQSSDQWEGPAYGGLPVWKSSAYMWEQVSLWKTVNKTHVSVVEECMEEELRTSKVKYVADAFILHSSRLRRRGDEGGKKELEEDKRRAWWVALEGMHTSSAPLRFVAPLTRMLFTAEARGGWGAPQAARLIEADIVAEGQMRCATPVEEGGGGRLMAWEEAVADSEAKAEDAAEEKENPPSTKDHPTPSQKSETLYTPAREKWSSSPHTRKHHTSTHPFTSKTRAKSEK